MSYLIVIVQQQHQNNSFWLPSPVTVGAAYDNKLVHGTKKTKEPQTIRERMTYLIVGVQQQHHKKSFRLPLAVHTAPAAFGFSYPSPQSTGDGFVRLRTTQPKIRLRRSCSYGSTTLMFVRCTANSQQLFFFVLAFLFKARTIAPDAPTLRPRAFVDGAADTPEMLVQGQDVLVGLDGIMVTRERHRGRNDGARMELW